MAALTAFLVLAMAAISFQSVVYGMRQQTDAGLSGGGGSGGSGGGGSGGSRPSAYPALRFRSDQTFKILQLTDLHYGEDRRLDEKSDQFQRDMIAAEQPDLVVFSGDMVSGWVCTPSTERPLPVDCGAGWFERRWRQLTAPVHEAGVPYAITLGNHDAEADLTRREIVDLDIRTGGLRSLTRQGPPQATGASNYHLDIRGPPGSDAPAARIWLLDSMNRFCPPLMFGWGCVAPDTLAWLNQTSAGLPRLPSLAFVHIPIPQFKDAWYDAPTVGRKEEDVACSARDTGLFRLAKELGLTAIYSGHDHNNDYAGVLDGIRLAYGRKSGYGGYGPPPGWLRGARVIELRLGEDAAASILPCRSKTWIRQADGSVAVQEPSDQPKGMRQLECHSDEYGQQGPPSQQQQQQQQQQDKPVP